MADVFITAAGFVDGARFGNPRASQVMSCRDLSHLRWGEISDAPFDRFGRLDGLCKAAMIAVEMLGLEAPSAPRADWAISAGTEHGSVEVDAAFLATIGQPGGASPLLFSYTLPSILIGEIAIRHRITGPGGCYMAGGDSGALALWEGVNVITSGEARACLCIGCDSVSSPVSREPHTEAWAFLMEKADSPAGDRTTPLAEITMSPCPAATDARPALPRLFEFLASGSEADFTLQAPCAMGAGSGILIRHTRRDCGRSG
jgi:hypothetical protein